MDGGSWHCTADRDQDLPQEKEMLKSKMAVWGGLTNSCDSPWQWLNQTCCCCCSVAKSYSLLLHGLQHARLFCTPLSPGVCSDSCPLSQWCHQTTSSFVVPFSCLQSFPASGSFPMSWLFTSGGQSINTPFLQLHNIRAFHYQRNGHESEQTPGDSGVQKSLACWSPWSSRE